MMGSCPPADVLLAIDIGNSRVGLGVWDSDGIHDVQRVAATCPQDWPAALEQAWAATAHGKRRAVVIGSVVPERTRQLRALVQQVCGVEALRVRDDLPLPMPLAVDNPQEVGVDRVCSAAAAYSRVGGACAVASFGTATTIDCVSQDGEFLGGAILPGLAMCCEALHRGTAQLPLVEVAEPRGPFGRNTREAVINGVVYAAVGSLREIVERFATELRQWPYLVVTGGYGGLVAKLADFVDAVVPDLCLMGIALAYRKAAGQQ
jgi:type III pantothenate kinase